MRTVFILVFAIVITYLSLGSLIAIISIYPMLWILNYFFGDLFDNLAEKLYDSFR